MSLQPFEGRDVIQASMRITRAGDGLSGALRAAPTEYHTGDELYVLLKCEVGKIIYEPILDRGDDTGDLRRVHTLVTALGTVVNGKWADQAIAAQQKKNLEAAGVVELPGLDGDE